MKSTFFWDWEIRKEFLCKVAELYDKDRNLKVVCDQILCD